MDGTLLRVQPKAQDTPWDKGVSMDSRVCRSEPDPQEEAYVTEHVVCNTE